MAVINEQELRTSTFKGFVQFQDPAGSTYYRMKERQNFGITLNFSYSEHYSDSGQKAFDPSGYNHSFNMTLKVTSDMIDDANPPTDKKTISYWIYKAVQNDPLDITFVGKMIALNAPDGETNEHRLWYKFKGRITQFGTGWSGTGGSQDWVMSGDILEINTIERSSSDTEPTATTNWFP
jgi:hypothetical protein